MDKSRDQKKLLRDKTKRKPDILDFAILNTLAPDTSKGIKLPKYLNSQRIRKTLKASEKTRNICKWY